MNKFLPDDPKLTAYALGELDPADRAAVEAALRDDPAARAAVEEIRAMGAQLEGALALEARADFTSEKMAAAPASVGVTSLPEKNSRQLDGMPRVNGHRPSPLAQVIRFPQFYYVVGGVAAACFALMVALRAPKPPPAPQATYTTIDLSSLPTAASSKSVALPVAAAESDKTAVAPAPTAVVVNLAPPPGTKPVEMATASPTVPANSSLLAQAKATAADQARLRGQLASATQTYPADAKMLVDAQPKAATRATPVAPAPALSPQAGGDVVTLQAFEVMGARPTTSFGASSMSTAKNGITLSANDQSALNFSGGATLATTGSVTLGASGSAGTTSGLVLGTGGAVASSGNGMIFNESRGLARYLTPVGSGRSFASADRYAAVKDNEFLGVTQNPLSTFSIDVDTASYSNVRRFLRGHQRPPRDAVRIEELVNYFPYRYPPPAAAVQRGEGTASPSPAEAVPFAASLEVAEAPWAPTHRLVRIGLKGREVSTASRPVANLVFLLDVSGSMNAPNRLPLVKESMRLLVGKLRPDDRVAIVTYAGNSGLALASTPVAQASEILEALDSLTPGGSTNGGMGITLAYDIAKANFAVGGINRVILCTDGDFNVGVTGEGELTRLIEEKAKSGVALTALGFGMGNLKDATLEKLADRGNGNYGYIDTRREAEKLLVEQVNGTLVTIAKDVKIQVEFNPARVASYRLIGYENGILKKEDFNNDAVDAGEIGAGHTVTAFYEIVPVGAEDPAASNGATVDELKYRKPDGANRKDKATDSRGAAVAEAASNELLTVKLRYKAPTADVSQRIEFPLTDGGAKFVNASTDFKFAAAVASFGMILRESPHKGTATIADVVTWAEAGNTDDAGGYRAEFIELAHEAEKLER